MDSRVFDVTIAICSEFFAEERAVLVLDVFDDGVPAKMYRAIGVRARHNVSMLCCHCAEVLDEVGVQHTSSHCSPGRHSLEYL